MSANIHVVHSPDNSFALKNCGHSNLYEFFAEAHDLFISEISEIFATKRAVEIDAVFYATILQEEHCRSREHFFLHKTNTKWLYNSRDINNF